MTDHYKALGVRRTATHEEIKAAYRAKAKDLHPDVSTAPDAEVKFLALKEAYETVGDPDRRQAYDTALAYHETLKRQAEEQAAARAASEFFRSQAAQASAPPKTKPPHEEQKTKPHQGRDVLQLAALLSRSQFRDAEILANQILGRDPKEPLAHAALGDIFRHRGELERAARQYALAAQHDPNAIRYHQRHVEMLEAIATGRTQQQKRSESGIKPFPVGVGIFAVVCMAAVLVMGTHPPLMPGLPLISAWSATTVGMLLMGGIAVGASFSASDLVDRYHAAQKSAISRASPATTLAVISILSFWAAMGLYLLVGATQQAFSASLSRIMGGVAAVVGLLSLASWRHGDALALQTLVWGGNLAYAGAMMGWAAADSLRRPG